MDDTGLVDMYGDNPDAINEALLRRQCYQCYEELLATKAVLKELRAALDKAWEDNCGCL